MTRARTALVLAGSLVPALAAARPLDPTDPTPRTIQVEFEVSFPPGTVGQTWSTPFQGTYSATGNTGTVVIPASVYESAIQTHDLDYFDVAGASLIPGSASEFRLDIDLTTLEATAQPVSYDVSVTIPSPQDGTVTRALSTTATAGYVFLPQYPGIPFFCDTCTLVPGAPYDPSTGRINAVGSDLLDSADIMLRTFWRAGDLRISELDVPGVPAIPGYAFLLAVAVLAGLGRTARPARRSG